MSSGQSTGISVEPVLPLEPVFDTDTVEQRMIRAEELCRGVLAGHRDIVHAVRSVELALSLEGTPPALTYMGAIRWLGDQRRAAETRALAAERRVVEAERYRLVAGGRPRLRIVEPIAGQMTVDDCIAEVRRA